jgi:hypothetical protein
MVVPATHAGTVNTDSTIGSEKSPPLLPTHSTTRPIAAGAPPTWAPTV